MLKKISSEERWNVYTHSFGAIASFISIIYIITNSDIDSQTTLISLFVYGFSLVFLFTTSSIYHSQIGENRAKWQKIDHIGIYYLIAGTYTPVCLTVLYETSGKLILSLIWGLALIGTIYKILFINKFNKLSLFLYLFMGWLIIIDIKNLYHLISEDMLICLVSGGLFYSFGIIFYLWEKLYFNHVIWHFFVLFGAASHYLFIIRLVNK